MEKYLYLTRREWVFPWINGGPVPLSFASKYRSHVRSGVYTPDENLIDSSSHDVKTLSPMIMFGGGAVRNVSIGSIVVNGEVTAENVFVDRFEEDVLVLCLCNRKNRLIAERLGKVACVRIDDIDRLVESFSDQLGVPGEMGSCQYTSGHQRNHFLKSIEDQWQDEFRVVWRSGQERSVVVPRGIAKSVKL